MDVAVEKQYMDYEPDEPEFATDYFTNHLKDPEEGKKNTLNFCQYHLASYAYLKKKILVHNIMGLN